MVLLFEKRNKKVLVCAPCPDGFLHWVNIQREEAKALPTLPTDKFHWIP